MRDTPRQLRVGRGIGTLIGNGWLRESPRNPFGARWADPRGRSALRKCMYLPVPEEIRALAPPQVSPAALPPAARVAPKPAKAEEIVPHRHDPARDAREFPAFPPRGELAAARQAYAAMKPASAAKGAARAHANVAGAPSGRQAWWEDPIALGSLLILCPPIGLAAVWMSKRYSNDARWALTVMTALTMCLMSAVVIAALVMR